MNKRKHRKRFNNKYIKALGKPHFYFALIIFLIIGASFYTQRIQPDGKTIESRRELISDFPKYSEWIISDETEINGYIISSIFSHDNKSGIAVFEPLKDGKYKLLTKEWREQNEIIITGVIIENNWYDIVWFDGAKTDYAQITYTVGGTPQEPIIHNSQNKEIFVNPAPSDDYTLKAIYYDNEGNIYE